MLKFQNKILQSESQNVEPKYGMGTQAPNFFSDKVADNAAAQESRRVSPRASMAVAAQVAHGVTAAQGSRAAAQARRLRGATDDASPSWRSTRVADDAWGRGKGMGFDVAMQDPNDLHKSQVLVYRMDRKSGLLCQQRTHLSATYVAKV